VQLSDTSAGQGFASWRKNVQQGRVFVSMGPMVRLSVNGAGPGDTVNLPAGGGEGSVEAELSAPPELRALELVRSGHAVETETRVAGDPIRKIKLRKKLKIEESCWLAARGTGVHIVALDRDALAHTAAVRVLVGGHPIRSSEDSTWLITHL